MENEFMKRGYLLPEGCKDLIDVWKFKFPPGRDVWKPQFLFQAPWPTAKPQHKSPTPGPTAPPSPIVGEIVFSQTMTVGELAKAVKQKPVVIIADLMGLGVFATMNQLVSFEMAARVARRFGYTLRKEV
jgi:hypothetical protein